MFPYEDYKAAIEDESNTRNTGVEAMVLDCEKVDAESGWMLQVEPLGQCVESEIEGGTVTQCDDDGEVVFQGEIVSYDGEEKFLSLKRESSGTPRAGALAVIRPPDYLAKLREFASRCANDPTANAPLDERFMHLRETLLRADEAPASPWTGDASLRPAQRQAAANAFSRDFSFIWGPPGTGKSYTLGHIAAELVARGQRVLVLANTNAATDVTTLALDDAFSAVGRPLAIGELVRYTRVITHEEDYAKRPHLLAYTKLLERFAKERHELEKTLRKADRKVKKLGPELEGFGAAMAEASALRQEIKLLDSRRKDELAELMSTARIVCASVTCCIYNEFQNGSFDAVIVDEASLVPQAAWPCLLHASENRRFIVAGDPMQLVPVSARSIDTATHVWFDNNLYTYLGMSEFRSIAPFIKTGAVALLTEQTRMRRGLCEMVSRMFYDGRVTGDRTNPPIAWREGSGIPEGDVVLMDPSSAPESHGLGRIPANRWKNTSSASAGVAIDLLHRIEAYAPKDRDISVEIITPFRNQAARVYGYRLKGRDMKGRVSVSWSTIHCCQGSEADIVILDLVNPGSFFLNGPDAAHLWCVACSRAKEKLIVLGECNAVRAGTFSGPMFGSLPVSELKKPEQIVFTDGKQRAA